MSAFIGKQVARRFVSKQSEKEEQRRLEEGRDPFYFYATDKRGRKRKQAKANPEHYPKYIPLEDRKRLNSFRKYAKLMDTALFGQVGADFVIGLVPVFGDFAAAGIAQQLVQRYASKVSCGLPKWVYAKMIRNIVIDLGLGLVPLLGDVADALWKANTKNLILLEDHLRLHFAMSNEAPSAGIVMGDTDKDLERDAGMNAQQSGVVPAPVATKQSGDTPAVSTAPKPNAAATATAPASTSQPNPPVTAYPADTKKF